MHLGRIFQTGVIGALLCGLCGCGQKSSPAEKLLDSVAEANMKLAFASHDYLETWQDTSTDDPPSDEEAAARLQGLKDTFAAVQQSVDTLNAAGIEGGEELLIAEKEFLTFQGRLLEQQFTQLQELYAKPTIDADKQKEGINSLVQEIIKAEEAPAAALMEVRRKFATQHKLTVP